MSDKQVDKIVKKLLKNQCTLKELGCGINTIRQLKDIGYQIQCQTINKQTVYYIRTVEATPIILVSGYSRNEETVKILELSDLHFGSIQCDEFGMREVLKKAVDEGFVTAHISGDITDGYKIYPGHQNNLKYWLCQDQANYASEVLGDFPEIHYFASKGNHDFSFEKLGSVSPLYLIQQNVPNFVFMNGYAGDIIISGVAKRLVHLDGGRSYAKSYVGQTYIRNLLDSHGEHIFFHGKKYRLRMLQFGHYHTEITYESAGIYCTHPGNFQFPNDYTIRRGLVGPQGCRFTTVTICEGKIIRYQSEFVTPKKR